MKALRNLKALLVVYLGLISSASGAQVSDTTLFLITCGPGTEVYSIYGHSALLVRTGETETVYNWGVFDFDTPNFVWKFAKGRLDYMLASEPLDRFLRGYFYEGRYVLSQMINLEPHEKRIMLELIEENLRPENVRYRYDFFYDDCSTRIRDLLEKSTGNSLRYPDEKEKPPTFRDLIGEYQQFYPWLQFGVDLLIGSNAEKKAGLRDRMFLPEYLMSGLSVAEITRDGHNAPLLSQADILLDFQPPAPERLFYKSPFFVFSMLFVLIAFLSFKIKSLPYNNMMDFILFFIFSALAVMLVFFNFFTDHEQLRSNYNMLWLNPLIIILFVSLITGRNERLWSRAVFFITVIFLIIHLLIPQAFNIANYPLMFIIILRTMTRSEFGWSPVRV